MDPIANVNKYFIQTLDARLCVVEIELPWFEFGLVVFMLEFIGWHQ